MSPVHIRLDAASIEPRWAARDTQVAGPDPDLLAPAPTKWLAAREVSKWVAVANDGPELLEHPAPAQQLTLI